MVSSFEVRKLLLRVRSLLDCFEFDSIALWILQSNRKLCLFVRWSSSKRELKSVLSLN